MRPVISTSNVTMILRNIQPVGARTCGEVAVSLDIHLSESTNGGHQETYISRILDSQLEHTYIIGDRLLHLLSYHGYGDHASKSYMILETRMWIFLWRKQWFAQLALMLNAASEFKKSRTTPRNRY